MRDGSENELESPSEDLRMLYEAADVETLAPHHVDALLRQVQGKITAPSISPETSPPEVKGPSSAASAGPAALKSSVATWKVALVSLALGTGLGALLDRAALSVTAPEVPPSVEQRPIDPPSAEPPRQEPAPVQVVPPTPVLAPEAPAPIEASAPAPSSHLASEQRLVETARAAIARGRFEDGLEVLARCRRLFPHGSLAEERDALNIEALLRAHEDVEGQRQLAAFESAYPASLYRGRLARLARELRVDAHEE